MTTSADVNLGSTQLSACWGKVYVVERNFRRLARYRAASQQAKQNDRGAWAMCGDNFHKPQSESA